MIHKTIVEANTITSPIMQESVTARIEGTPDFDAYVAVGISVGDGIGASVGISVGIGTPVGLGTSVAVAGFSVEVSVMYVGASNAGLANTIPRRNQSI